ncbi:MAG: TauD/TfdA dioxygenase family protein, partial [Alphaproteobacteria bacterium]
LDDAGLVRLASRFGRPTPAHPVISGLDEHPEVFVVDNEKRPESVRRHDLAAGDTRWHTDVTFVERPPLGSLLHARTLPPRGGDTQWADLVDAYASLPGPLQRLADELEAVHDGRPAFGYVSKQEPADGAPGRLAALRPVVHPVVRIHPETGERALFVNPAFTTRIVGLSPEDGATILRIFFSHITRPERTVRWRWEKGDLAFWDNRATAHYAIVDYGDAPRRLHRVTLEGDRPVGPGRSEPTPEFRASA